MIDDQQAHQIRDAIDEQGVRGPIVLKWIRELLDDRRKRQAEAGPASRPR